MLLNSTQKRYGKIESIESNNQTNRQKKSMWICFEAIIDDWGQFVSRLVNGISLCSGRNLGYVMTYWTRFVVAVNVVKPIIKARQGLSDVCTRDEK